MAARQPCDVRAPEADARHLNSDVPVQVSEPQGLAAPIAPKGNRGASGARRAARVAAPAEESPAGAFPKPNSSGVYDCRDAYESLRHVDGRWGAQVDVVQVGLARWAYGYKYDMASAGGCSAPSKHWTVMSRDDAYVAGLVIVVKTLARLATGTAGCVDSQAARRAAKRAIEGLFEAVPEVVRRQVVAKVIEGRDRG